jgi:hypothetical protein
MRRLIGTAVILIAIFAGLGFYFDWFKVYTQKTAPTEDKTKITLEIDKEKMKEDTDAAKDKAGQLGEKVKEKVDTLVGAETARGTVSKVQEAGDRFTVTTSDNKELSFETETSSQIRRDDKEVPAKDLKVGDPVTVEFKVKNGKKVARSITIERAR